MTGHEMINSDGIQGKIHTVRGLQVMLDSDLAELYQVEAKNLNRAVKRNIERFPVEFMFQLTSEEHNSLRFQIGTLNNTRGQHRKYLPFAFTEQGVSNAIGCAAKRDGRPSQHTNYECFCCHAPLYCIECASVSENSNT